MKKFRSAVTDSEMSVHYGEGKDGINNLMTIYAAVTGKTMETIEQEFAGKGYGDFKTAVGEAVIAELGRCSSALISLCRISPICRHVGPRARTWPSGSASVHWIRP